MILFLFFFVFFFFILLCFFFFNDTATTEIYTLSLHDALPILKPKRSDSSVPLSQGLRRRRGPSGVPHPARGGLRMRDHGPQGRRLPRQVRRLAPSFPCFPVGSRPRIVRWVGPGVPVACRSSISWPG